MKVLDGGLGDFSIIIFWDLPSGFHHSHEVLITWGAHRKVAIVIVELFPGDNAIIITSSSIEVIEELSQNIIFSFFAFKELWVHGYIIDSIDI